MNEFATIKQILCEKNELWEDPEFRAVQSSVFYHQTPPFQFQWRRPKELCPEPVFVNDDVDDDDDDVKEDSILSDIEPGKMGDQWLVNCFAILRQNDGLFYRAVPADQSFGPETQYAGIFRFRIWWCGEWIEVTVDDRLPTINNKLAFLHSNRTNQFWPSLLEKAYAKLHGSYEALKYGSFLDGLADLTGGIAESLPVPLDLNHCLKMLYNFSNVTSIVTCIVQDTNDSQKKNRTKNDNFLNGLEPDTNYGFYGIEKISKYNGDLEICVRLRNLLDENRSMTNNYSKPHEFLMPLKEFARTFTHFELIHLDRETSRDETRLCTKQSWLMKTVHGFWQKGVTAGGCRNNTETFHINPQLLVCLNESDEIIISLNQHSVLEPTVIGFTLYQLDSIAHEPLPITFFNRTKSLVNSQYSNTRQISQRCRLVQSSTTTGTESIFLLMPTTFEPGHESKFTLRILSCTNVKLKWLDLEPTVVKCAISKAPPLIEARNFGQFEQAFLQLADEHRSISAFDLLELLDACLPNDYIRSCATLDVCRQIVLTFDISNNGRMKFKDFKDFMFSLKNWQNIFKAFTKEKSGVLKAEKFRDAIKDAGYIVSAEILSILCHRHIRKDGTFRFGDFVSAILHLITAFRIFESKNVMQNGSIKMTLSEWLKLSQIS